jgi:leader peptidase (prepilin peptidase) / N-methyltransferase
MVLAAGVVLVLLWPRATAGELALLMALAALVPAIALIDIRHYRVPDLLSLPVALLGVAFCLVEGGDLLLARTATALALLAAFYLFRIAFLRVRKVDGLGLGDVKFIAAAAFWLDPFHVADYILAASLGALVQALILRRVLTQTPKIPFGAHLSGWLLVFAVAAIW